MPGPSTDGLQTLERPTENLLVAVVRAGIPGGGYEGTFGNAVFYESGGRMLMRERVDGRNPQTPEQQAGRLEQGRVARMWRTLDDDAFAAWEAAGGYRLYMSLTRRWLRVHPGGTPPTFPPAGPFMGDAVRLSASGNPSPLRGRGAGVRGGACVEDGPLPQPPLQDEPLGEGAFLSVSADRANSAGVVTEIRIQPLAHRRRKPKESAWRSAGFFAFAAAGDAAVLPVEPGAWAVSARFLRADSGQATETFTVGAVDVV